MLAIHRTNSPFADKWIIYCQLKGIPYRIVDCYSSDIIDQVKGCDSLMWQWFHSDFKAQLFARQLIASIEKMGIRVFPNSSTCWHYDDKVGQKYLLEAVGAPLIPSHVFYNKMEALTWVSRAELPIVCKFRRGAGSQNVRLLHDTHEAKKFIRRSFGRGWTFSRFDTFKERIWQFRRDRTRSAFIKVPRALWWVVFPNLKSKGAPREQNYVYIQDFAPQNSYDIRVVVIGNRAFAIKRMVREGDFRASGSGILIYDLDQIPLSCIRIAFEVTKSISSQSCAFDFVLYKGAWSIIEISYMFAADAYRVCQGYWDGNLKWHDLAVEPEQFMIEDMLASKGAYP